jgi:hypothetical protein
MTMVRRFARRLLLALTIPLALVACTPSSLTGPAEPPASTGEPDLLLGGLLDPVLRSPLVTGLTDVVGGLLSCRPESYVRTSKVIGPEGGSLTLGQHRLVVPPGALDRRTTITGEVVRGFVNSVRFAPHGLRFERAAVLTMGYGNCRGLLRPKKIAYTSELLDILEVLQSLDNPRLERVTAPIDHFSRYAVAW